MSTSEQTNTEFSEPDARRWLSWMARGLQRTGHTVFLFEQLQPTWLRRFGQLSGMRLRPITLSLRKCELPPIGRDRQLVDFINGKFAGRVTPSELSRYRRDVADSVQAHTELQRLEANGWGRFHDTPTAGRPRWNPVGRSRRLCRST